MKAIKFFSLFFLLLPPYIHAQQDSSATLMKTIHGDIVDFAVDNLGNIYLLSSENRLKKLSAGGDSLAVYNDVRTYGKVSEIDVTNPLKILLYYKEFATIVMVDRFLNIVNSIDLRKLNIFQAPSIGLAYDNSVWVFDDLEAKLKRINDDGTLIDQTTDMRQLFDSVPEPSAILDQSGFVYLYDSTKGVYIFDHYGALQRHVRLQGWIDFNVIDKNLLGRDLQHFFRYTSGQIDLQVLPIPPAYLPALKIIIMPKGVYVLKPNSLEIYSTR